MLYTSVESRPRTWEAQTCTCAIASHGRIQYHSLYHIHTVIGDKVIIACSFHIQEIFTDNSRSACSCMVLYSQPIDIAGYNRIQIRAKVKVILGCDSDLEIIGTSTSVGMDPELSIEEVDVVVIPALLHTSTGVSDQQVTTKFNYCIKVNIKHIMGSTVDTYWTAQ